MSPRLPDSPLTQEGIEFSNALSHFFETDDTGFSVVRSSNCGGLVVWSSTQLASLTATKIKSSRYVEWRALRNIESGVCDGLTYEQIKAKYPQEYKARQRDKLRYRYPRGESYVDVITRLEPVIFEVDHITHSLAHPHSLSPSTSLLIG
jgi:6-phosphofructo-2-kinase / fructose-2,6-biphosphatase 3